MSLKNLQKQWYKLLEETGFKDIENTETDRLHKWHGELFSKQDPNIAQTKLEYYLCASSFLEHYPFKSHVFKEVWRLHSEGVSMRSISKHLNSHEIKINKDKVNEIIKFLRKEMHK